MQTDLDLVIIGAGCAGLGLGVELAKFNNETPKTLLLESREEYQNDRTWCFWKGPNSVYSELISHQWTKLIVRFAKEEISCDCSFAPYQILPSSTFYDFAKQVIDQNSKLTLQMGNKVLKEPLYQEGWWHIETQFGPIRTKTVVDTRPKPYQFLKKTKLWQSFLGYEIESSRAIFDPSTAQLMDFFHANRKFIGFNYILPQTARKALIEFTVFADKPYLPDELKNQLDQSIREYLNGSDFKISRTESGIIPMGVPSVNLDQRYQNNQGYVHVGLTAGGARASTGYAFQRIQKWAVDCAQAIKHNGLPISHTVGSFLLTKMDDIFLNVIRNNPELGPTLFMHLFKKVKTKRLVRFLTDTGNILDYIAVVRALPVTPFLKVFFSDFNKNEQN
ncbi:MAG: hypothetical protein KGN31_06650 [Betaproteobacteria bacterium]|nr:hypothetical protein [Betaproteobacteria bacterium]